MFKLCRTCNKNIPFSRTYCDQCWKSLPDCRNKTINNCKGKCIYEWASICTYCWKKQNGYLDD